MDLSAEIGYGQTAWFSPNVSQGSYIHHAKRAVIMCSRYEPTIE